MQELSAEKDRIKVTIKAVPVGQDLCVIVAGGDKPHIGCAVVSVSRPSLKDDRKNSATTSVINLVGHKDDEVLRDVAQILCTKLKKNVVVTGGIHVDDITGQELTFVMDAVRTLTDTLISQYQDCLL